MAITENLFTGDGSTTNYSFTFEYIESSEVKADVAGVTTTDFTFANATTLSFNTAPANGAEVRIYRDTDIDTLKATFFAGSAIKAEDLNNNFTQSNFAVQEIKNNTWDSDLQTIKSNETWVSTDDQIATTAAMDQRFQDEAAETILSTETWVSDDDHMATTAAIDARFQDELDETITSSEAWIASDNTIATTQAIENRVDEIITNDIGTDGTGITVTDDGDGTITLGLAAGSIDLDRIKDADIVTSAEANPNNDTTIATTAKIDDMIDAAITGDIAVDGTGLTLTDDGDGTITLGIGAGSVDLDRIKPGDIITYSETSVTPTDASIFTSSAAARRFDTIVQTSTPAGTDWEVGKTWLQNDVDKTLSVWDGDSWEGVSSGGTFINQAKVVYVDAASGNDLNDGHRISRPKDTIKAAINQINAEINTSITAGGSGYTDGTYVAVALTGGTSTGLTADITVASGVVTTVTINNSSTLEDYSIGDVLTASDADLGGGGGSGLQVTVGGDGDGQVVIVSPGIYQEIAPIQIKRRNVSIIGQSLRSCIVHPTVATETNTLFELNSGSYLSNLTFTGVKAGTGTGNTLDADLPVSQGWNAAFYSGAYIIKSPYIQNCTNFSDSEIDNSDLNAFNPAGGSAGDVDSAPTGGGLLVNGSTVSVDSPLRSMVCDSYTHVGLNGPGILVTNNGYAQCTSSYAFFNKYHIKCLNGGQANLAASTTDFGDEALVADGKSSAAIFTAITTLNAADGDTTFTIGTPVRGTWHGSATRPQGNMLVDVNGITYPVLSATANGSGWDVTISRPNPSKRSENLGLNGAVNSGAAVEFYLRSMIASSGHTMEYVGSGTNYSALPENGGVPDDSKQIVESNYGKVWTAITDQNGKFKIGDFFEVDQRTGFINFSAGSYAFDVVTDTTPELGGQLDALTNKIVNLGTPTASTDAATKGYVDSSLSGFDKLSEGNTEAEVVDTGSDGHFKVTTEGTERLRIDSSGRVGIGTSSPARQLTLYNSSTPIIQLVNSTTGQTANDGVMLYESGSNFVIENQEPGEIQIYNNGSQRAVIDSSGNVGIGTSSPDSGLHIVRNTNPVLKIDRGSNNAANFNLYYNGTLRGQIGGASNSFQLSAAGSTAPMEFYTNGSERMRIDSSGNVGIGTSNPTAPLSVVHSAGNGFNISRNNGTVSINGNYGGTGDKAVITTSTNLALAFHINGDTERARIDSSGRLLVGTSSSAGNYKVQISGEDLYLSGASSYSGYANIRLSSDRARISSQLEASGGTPGASLQFYTMPTNGSITERLRVASTGAIGLSGANYGTSGQVMTSNGSGSAPTWQDAGGGAWNLISTTTASGASTVDITSGIDSTYKNYILTGTNVTLSSTQLQCHFYNNGSLVTGTKYKWMVFTDTLSSGSSKTTYTKGTQSANLIGLNYSYQDGDCQFQMHIPDPSTSKTLYSGSIAWTNGNDTGSTRLSSESNAWAMFNSVAFTNLNGIRLFVSGSGTLSGTFKLYGIS